MDGPAPIYFANPGAQALELRDEILHAMSLVLSSGQFVLGPQVELFEKSFAAYLGAPFCCGVASGSDALALALAAVGVRPGDEVITVSHSAVATVAAIEHIGAVPVLVDVETDSRCLDPALLERAAGPRTRAVVPVHIYGQPARMDPILHCARKLGLKVVEDCAQAAGASIGGRRAGTFGDAGAFSFYPTKNLGALGDGGAVITNRSDVHERMRRLRQYGWRERYVSEEPGWNSRLDEIQAAVLSVKLRHLNHWIEERNALADWFKSLLENSALKLPAPIHGTAPARHLYVVESFKRDALRLFLEERGIHCGIHYPQPIHRQPAYRGRLKGASDLPVTEALAERVLSLPFYPELGEKARERISHAFQEAGKAGSI